MILSADHRTVTMTKPRTKTILIDNLDIRGPNLVLEWDFEVEGDCSIGMTQNWGLDDELGADALKGSIGFRNDGCILQSHCLPCQTGLPFYSGVVTLHIDVKQRLVLWRIDGQPLCGRKLSLVPGFPVLVGITLYGRQTAVLKDFRLLQS
eukprot:gnl/Dysnectes_brevis/888_a983_2112.p1 GENE.gnl/Dysnectes_brevis/888_a983_2112~~gnl/Dysnectes_brevis/888_a983_2112.p1  ORF type:complete len:150 (-),score=19.42 gnl/Dysnectes_brevis/888_a983_2112:54-503(-)